MNYLKMCLRTPYLYLGIIGILLFTNIGSVYYFMNFYESSEPVSCPECPAIEEVVEEEKEVVVIPTIKVDIKGYVKNPGVYEVNEGTIVNELIAMAGGLKSSGTTDNINLSKKLNNEDMIVVLSKTELKKRENAQSITSKQNTSTTVTTSENGTNTTANPNTKISLNHATKEELMTLNGIGEAKALSIIEYRSKTPFQNISEIMNISGIGESVYEKIKDFITV